MAPSRPDYPTVESAIGNTPLVALQRLPGQGAVVLAKLEGNNPGGSVKDRPVLSMVREAEARGDIAPGDTLVEATSGNTGIALALIAAMKGYRMVIVMPEDASEERAIAMRAYGAELVLTPREGGMEQARDTAHALAQERGGRILDQFANPDNPLAHYRTTGPELWEQTGGAITHFVSAMGTTGTIVGTGRYLKERSPDVRVIGVQPEPGSRIPGIRAWPPEYVPTIYSDAHIDELRFVDQATAEQTSRELAWNEGIFAGASSGGAAHVALQVAAENPGATVVFVVCDRGDRYLSTGIFPS